MSLNFDEPENPRPRPSRNARRRAHAGQAWRSRYRASSLVEMLEARQMLSALVTTDPQDYAPGSTAYITAASDANPGTNFQVGETVQFRVTRTDGVPDFPPANQPWDVTDGVGGFTPYQDSTGMWWYPDTDGKVDGNIGTSCYVDSQYAGASLQLTATGLTSGAVATELFTDGTANSGDGTMAVSPSSVPESTIGNTLTFTFQTDQGIDFNNGSQATVLIPSDWTAPQTTNPSAPGYVTVAATANGTVGTPTVSGQLITIPFTANGGGTPKGGFTVTFANATAPSTVETSTFTTQTMQAGGTLTDIHPPSAQPKVTVTAANAPVPTTTSVSPTSASEGGAAFTLTVNGTNFVGRSVVQWNGTALATTVLSATQLQATVPASDLAEEGSASVTVNTPAPGGGTSNAQTFTVTDQQLTTLASANLPATGQ